MKWVHRTPKNLKDPNLYKLDHIIPSSLINRFLTLYFGVKNNENSDDLRIISATASTLQRISMGFGLIYTCDFEQLKKIINENSKLFEEDNRAYLTWLPGNLFFGFKERSDEVDDNFEHKSMVIIGYDRHRIALCIYNRMLNFTDDVGYTKSAHEKTNRKEKINEFVNLILSNKFLMDEMMEIYQMYSVFGLFKNERYQNNVNQWDEHKNDEGVKKSK